MAKSRQSLVQDKIGDMTECSICAEIYTNPKFLPCVHTFCLRCLEIYGKGKQPGEQIACPICRTMCLIPAGGLCYLPNNFFIGKMVEIGKLAVAPVNEVKCNICPEGEEIIGNRYCMDCEQILCERCSKSHKKIKFSQNHQIVELGHRLTAQKLNFCNSYCEYHPSELVKMYCNDDKEAICLICCVESHQNHRCVNVGKAAEEFTNRLKDDLKLVNRRLPECGQIVEKLERYRTEFLRDIVNAEKSIRDTGNKFKALIDRDTEMLVRKLKSVMDTKVKVFETTKQDVERFKVMVNSFSRFCEELLSRGSPVDICRTANQMQTRADELGKLPANCSGDCLRYETVVFYPLSIEHILKETRKSNVVGEITVIESRDRNIKFEIERKAPKYKYRYVEPLEFIPFGDANMMITEHDELYKSENKFCPISDRTIFVSDIPSDVTKHTLKLIFQNERHSGGLVERVIFDDRRSTAVITFEDPEVAKTMIQNGSVIFDGMLLTISKNGSMVDSEHDYTHKSSVYNLAHYGYRWPNGAY